MVVRLSHRLSIDPFAMLREKSNDVMMQFEEFSNVHNTDRTVTSLDRASPVKLYENNARSRPFCKVTKRSIAVATAM